MEIYQHYSQWRLWKTLLLKNKSWNISTAASKENLDSTHWDKLIHQQIVQCRFSAVLPNIYLCWREKNNFEWICQFLARITRFLLGLLGFSLNQSVHVKWESFEVEHFNSRYRMGISNCKLHERKFKVSKSTTRGYRIDQDEQGHRSFRLSISIDVVANAASIYIQTISHSHRVCHPRMIRPRPVLTITGWLSQ